MTTEKAIEIMTAIKNGTLGTVEYETSIPVNKDWKKSGVKIFCKTKKMVRFGADYKNLVKEVASADVKPRTNNYSWVIDNKVSHNSSTDKDYVRVSNIKRKTISRLYKVVFADGSVGIHTSLSDLEAFLQPSYMKNSDVTKPVVQNISVDNIIAINGIVG